MNTTDDKTDAPNPLSHLFDNNSAWVERMLGEDPEYFSRLAHQQAPEYLWIGCSDSRVPANQIIGLPPGEVFVHRNIANVVGHSGCSGVGAALMGHRVGLADNWLRHVEDVREKHASLLDEWPMGSARHRRLVELNAIEQT